MYKEKLTPYSEDNPLGWTEADFRDVICSMINVRIGANMPLTPLLNCYYLNNSDEWHREKALTEKIFNGLIRRVDFDEAENEM